MKKSFATLIKLQKTYVDEQRRVVSQLLDNLDRIDRRMTELEIQKAREQAMVERNPAASMTYGAYLRSVIVMQRSLAVERYHAAIVAQQAQDRLAELFEDQKRYEIAEEARLEEIARTERRLETLELDEVGGIRHQRQRVE